MQSGPVVAVVGGGIIGMSVAWRLVQAGASVAVFDAGKIGNEASWAGAGMLAPGGEFRRHSLWSDLALESLSLYSDFVKELSDESGIPIDFRKCGAFEVAFSESEAEELRHRAALQNEFRIYSEQFPGSRIPGLRPGAVAAQYYPDDAVVNPRDVVQALRIACTRRGVRLEEFTRVQEIPLPAESGRIAFDAVVLASGAWSSQIRAQIDGRTAPLPKAIPIRGHLIAFEERTGLCDPILRHGHLYLLRRSGNLIIAGASEEDAGFERTIDGGIAADLAAKAGELVPELFSASYLVWNGLRPGSETGEPVIGRVSKSNIWLAYGHYRNGILLAPATARGIAREVLASDLTPASLQMGSFSPAGHRQ